MNNKQKSSQLKKGLLIYNQVDYDKNKWFAHQLISKANQFGLELSLVLRENLILTIEDGQFLASIMPEPSLSYATASLDRSEPSLHMMDASALNKSDESYMENVSTPIQSNLPLKHKLSPLNVDFVINRTRDTLIATHFEKMGCRVFNNSTVTELCNHKGKTHQLVNSAGIPSVRTMIGNIHYFKPNQLPFS